MKKVEDYVRSIPDFPEKGKLYSGDITTVIRVQRIKACYRWN